MFYVYPEWLRPAKTYMPLQACICGRLGRHAIDNVFSDASMWSTPRKPQDHSHVVTRAAVCVKASRDTSLGHVWQSDAALLPLRAHSNGTIEEVPGAMHVDFANCFIGGGVLSGGCVQEEILFAICPELTVALLRERMHLECTCAHATHSGLASTCGVCMRASTRACRTCL
jgi:hypothetical protein